MKKVHVIAHTHWDFEWYFTRQHARVQFAYHMDEVLGALESNQMDYYLLDGQMSIIDDYLTFCPENRARMAKLIAAKRLFVGPWYTQIDEMTTSGEAIVRNLQLGSKLAEDLGNVMAVGYLPDSFGQGADMPKIFNGFGIASAVFWRGMPAEKDARYFYWNSEDDSRVLVANIKNGYYAGTGIVDGPDAMATLHSVATDTTANNLVLPVGGDQRPVDFNLKQRIGEINAEQDEFQLIESNYMTYFDALRQDENLPTYNGEFVDATASKIHRGIYSSRADLKMLYDQLERLLTYVVEPLDAMAQQQGIPSKPGIIAEAWKVVARGQAHDSAGGCNSDVTNRDIYHRGIVALEDVESVRDYLLRKLSSTVDVDLDLFFWNPRAVATNAVQTVTVVTRQPGFTLTDVNGQNVAYDLLEQQAVDAATLRRNPAEQIAAVHYETTIALPVAMAATDWTGFKVTETATAQAPVAAAAAIENDRYAVTFTDGAIALTDKRTGRTYDDVLYVEDGGDEGDTYDYSPAFADDIVALDFQNASATTTQGQFRGTMTLSGQWAVAANLDERANGAKTGTVGYSLTLTLDADQPAMGVSMTLDNGADDHRMRLVFRTDVAATDSYADTPFGVLARPVVDPHLDGWEARGYREEPTAMRPMIHFANTHDDQSSWSYIGLGAKDFELIGDKFQDLAITLFRGVGFLGRPDLKRRLGDASGLTMKYVPTPDSQLRGRLTVTGALRLDAQFDAAALQANHQALASANLAFQNQTLDRFTTPLQYFMINGKQGALKHAPLLDVAAPALVISSVAASRDGRGVTLRLYNPTHAAIAAPGKVNLAQPASVARVNLAGKLEMSLATSTTEFTLPDFKPGQIQSFDFYPHG